MSELLPVPHPVVLDRDGNPWYRWKGTAVPPSTADAYSGMKRLTDAELAAEYWAAFADTNACADTPDDSFKKYEAIENTIHHFATLPHYDDPTETGTER